MKFLSLILVILISFAGCATFNHSEIIDTDKLESYASGQYRHDSSGPVGSFALAGSGGGWGTSGAGGFGFGALAVTTGPAKSNPYMFARSIATINYSKMLKSIKYDESGGVIEYQFEHKPLSSKGSISQSPSLPPSFGHQPIE
jgi:hypothetical protein